MSTSEKEDERAKRGSFGRLLTTSTSTSTAAAAATRRRAVVGEGGGVGCKSQKVWGRGAGEGRGPQKPNFFFFVFRWLIKKWPVQKMALKLLYDAQEPR